MIPSRERWPDTGPLKRVRGAGPGWPLWPPDWRASCITRRFAAAAVPTVRTIRHGCIVLVHMARPSRDWPGGTFSPFHSFVGGGGGGASGSRSWMAEFSSVPEAPSTAAWWIFDRMAKQPGG